MSMIQKPIEQADRAELMQFATVFLGLELRGNATPNEINAKIRAAWDQPHIFVQSDGPAVDMAGAPPPAVPGVVVTKGGDRMEGGPGRNDPKVRLSLHNEERDGVVTSREKEVGVNGYVWLLKRGMEIEIPLRVFYALENAERDVLTHDAQGTIHRQTMKSVGYNVISMPPPEEIAAWHAATDAKFAP